MVTGATLPSNVQTVTIDELVVAPTTVIDVFRAIGIRPARVGARGSGLARQPQRGI